MRVCNCAVPQCTAWKRSNHPVRVSSFKFPVNDPERCKMWVRAIKNPKYNDNTPLSELQGLTVRSLHFKPEEINSFDLKQSHGR